jgi:DNA-binding NarL/FixJ family response regulator
MMGLAFSTGLCKIPRAWVFILWIIGRAASVANCTWTGDRVPVLLFPAECLAQGPGIPTDATSRRPRPLQFYRCPNRGLGRSCSSMPMSQMRNANRSEGRRRVLLVDDHPMVRERLSEIINRESDLIVCGEAEDRHQALGAVQSSQPNLVIIDLTLKNSDGVELIRDIHCRWPAQLMLVVSMHDESLYAERVLRAGARGYITKQEATRSILQAIRSVLSGNIYLNPNIATRIIRRLTAGPPTEAVSPAEFLADRELQVFELTGRGLNTRQIARQLGISAKTVETYRRRIRDKLKLRDPADLLQSAITWAHKP